MISFVIIALMALAFLGVFVEWYGIDEVHDANGRDEDESGSDRCEQRRDLHL